MLRLYRIKGSVKLLRRTRVVWVLLRTRRRKKKILPLIAIQTLDRPARSADTVPCTQTRLLNLLTNSQKWAKLHLLGKYCTRNWTRNNGRKRHL